MSNATIHLQKTLCAMRWIALLAGRDEAASVIQRDQAALLQKGGAA